MSSYNEADSYYWSLFNVIDNLNEQAEELCPEAVLGKSQVITDEAVVTLFKTIVKASHVDQCRWLLSDIAYEPAPLIEDIFYDNHPQADLVGQIADIVKSGDPHGLLGLHLFQHVLGWDEVFESHDLPLAFCLGMVHFMGDFLDEEILREDKAWGSWNNSGVLGAAMSPLLKDGYLAGQMVGSLKLSKKIEILGKYPLAALLAYEIDLPFINGNFFLGSMDKHPEYALNWYHWTDIPWILEDYKTYEKVRSYMPDNDVDSEWLFGEFIRTFQS